MSNCRVPDLRSSAMQTHSLNPLFIIIGHGPEAHLYKILDLLFLCKMTVKREKGKGTS